MLRSNPHAALYSQLASPYPPHLYGLLPGSPANLPAIHERMKLEEEHRARIAREEEKAREREREEREREMREREREQREKELREQREKEQREREKREREMREREMREKEMREKEMREKEQREREMREKEMREREKMLQQHHFMQTQRNPYNLLGLFPPMVGLRPPSSLHPYGQMHPSLLGLPPLPTTLPSSLPLPPHHSQSPQNVPQNVVPTSSPGLIPLGLTPPTHSLQQHLFNNTCSTTLFPPPAHLYSPLAPPSASPSGLSNSSFSHPMLTNPVSSPQPIARPPSNTSTAQQSLNLSKTPISMASTTPPSSQAPQQYSRRDEKSTNNSISEQKPKPADLSNGSNVNSLNNSMKSEEKDEKPSSDSLKPAVLMEKPIIDPKLEVDDKKDEKIKSESPNSPKNIVEIDVKKEESNKVVESENNSSVTPMEVDKEDRKEDKLNDDATINDKDIDGTNNNNNETNKTSSKKS